MHTIRTRTHVCNCNVLLNQKSVACKRDKAASRRIFLEPWYDSIVTERGASRYAKPQREKERAGGRERRLGFTFLAQLGKDRPRGRFMPAHRRKQLLIRLRSAECNSNLNWRSRVARAQRRCSLRNFVTAEYFQPRRSRWLRGESIKGKSFSFTSAVARVQTFSFFPFLSFAGPRPVFFYISVSRSTLRFLRNVSWLARRSFHVIIRSTDVVSGFSVFSKITIFNEIKRCFCSLSWKENLHTKFVTKLKSGRVCDSKPDEDQEWTLYLGERQV